MGCFSLPDQLIRVARLRHATMATARLSTQFVQAQYHPFAGFALEETTAQSQDSFAFTVVF